MAFPLDPLDIQTGKIIGFLTREQMISSLDQVIATGHRRGVDVDVALLLRQALAGEPS